MRHFILLFLLLSSLAGCSTLKGLPSGVLHRYDAGRKLSSALQEEEQGRSTAAIAILEELIAEPGIKGVTDEALFRLSVLKLHSEEKDGSLPAIRYLERLRHDYRDSVWSQQAKPLLDSLYAVADLKKQTRNLKNINGSLARDNKELRQSIERLKSLDMQLERKTR